MDTTLVAVVSVLLAFVCSYVLHIKASAIQRREVGKLEAAIRELEKAVHLSERKALDERNQIELRNHDELKQAKTASFDEGRAVGYSDREKDYRVERMQLESEHREKIVRERDMAAAEAREIARREFEMQTKLFSVAVRPYVRITKDEGFFTNDYETQTGYQYQLLVNGIPAFQPHVVIESREEKKTVNDDNIKYLVDRATAAAEAAVQMYVGGLGPHVKFTRALVERATK